MPQDIALGETFTDFFTTVATTGAPITLAGSPTVAAFPDSGARITAGVSIAVDYNDGGGAITGDHAITVVATVANGFLPGKKYTVKLTAGTIGGTSAVGYKLAQFTIQNIVAGVVDGVCTTGGSTTSITTSACVPNAGATDSFKGRIVIFDRNTTTAALRGQASDITANTSGATPTLTVTALTTAPASTDRFRIY